jgi:hypothetical protein
MSAVSRGITTSACTALWSGELQLSQYIGLGRAFVSCVAGQDFPSLADEAPEEDQANSLSILNSWGEEEGLTLQESTGPLKLQRCGVTE